MANRRRYTLRGKEVATNVAGDKMEVKVELFFDFMQSERGVLLVNGDMPRSSLNGSITATISELYAQCIKIPMSQSFHPLSRPMVYQEEDCVVLCYRIVLPPFREFVKLGEIVTISQLKEIHHVAVLEKISAFH